VAIVSESRAGVVKVEFHSGVSEPLAYACRLLRKAQGAGTRVVVHGPAATLDRLDQMLWTFDALSFVPHLRLSGSARATPAQARTPTWLVDDLKAVDDREVLVNLGDDVVPGWDAFARVIEIVGVDGSSAARQRWRRYAQSEKADLVHHAIGGAS
jgi:DNA polymerase-3 subunit chi